MARPARLIAAHLIATAAVVGATDARAIEYDVNAESYAQAYQIRGPWGGPVLSARRFTQTLTLSLSHAFADRGPVLALRVRLRFDGEFGDSCGGAAARCLEETARERRTDFVPGYERRTVDLPYAYLDVSNLARGLFDLRVGRVVHSDVLGYFAYDGARLRAMLGSVATLEAYGGLEVRGGFSLSNARFERDGVFRADRSSWDNSLAPFVADRAYAPVFSASIETPRGLPAFARATYRRVWTRDGVSEERVGAAVDAQLHPRVRVDGRAAFSWIHRAFSVLGASVTYDHALRTFSLEASVERIRPTWDPSSIWASIWADAIDDARMRATIRPDDRWAISGAIYGRRYSLAESGASTNAASVSDSFNGGATVSLLRDTPSWDFGLRALGEGGATGARGGVDVDAALEPWGDRVRFDGRVSLWGNLDSLRPERSGPSLALVGGAAAKIGPIARLHIDGEYDLNAVAGHRFRAMATLSIGARP